jgi:hypothetical protein
MKPYTPKSITELEKAIAKDERTLRNLFIAGFVCLSMAVAGIVTLFILLIN